MFLLPFPIQKLTSIKIQNDKMRTGNLPANMKKNRVLQIIPCKSPLPTPQALVPHLLHLFPPPFPLLGSLLMISLETKTMALLLVALCSLMASENKRA